MKSPRYGPKFNRGKNIRAKVVPYIGSGLSQRQVARLLDCSACAVNVALKKLGAKL